MTPLSDDAVAWLMRSHVQSFGPMTGMALVNVRDSILSARVAAPATEPAVREEVAAVLLALNAVIALGVAHQGAVLETLAALIGEEETS